MAAPRLVAAGVTLRDQVNERFPKRDKASDGWLGDAAHQLRVSDHNPAQPGNWVRALDIDEDFGAKGDNRAFADQLVELAREGKDHGRLKYVVYEDKIASGTYADTFWEWRGHGYGHTHHIHVSFTSKADKDGRPFPLPILSAEATVGWDGKVPEYDGIINAMNDPELRNPAAWRLAWRLHGLDFFVGTPGDRGEQGYPVKAVERFQKARGFKVTGLYGPKMHTMLFG